MFTDIGSTYDRVGAVLSFGQDPRWRAALVGELAASATDRVLDVATGTGLVASAIRARYGCEVVGLDQSADMLGVAKRRGYPHHLIRGAAERLPFGDATFDHVSFTYLLRYVDDPAATMRELARVLRPGGRIAMAEFGMPRGIVRPLWWLYTRVGLPLGGRVVSRQWAAVGAFLGPSIDRFHRAHSAVDLERMWRDAGLTSVRSRRMSVGGGLVMSATRESAATPAGTATPAGKASTSLTPSSKDLQSSFYSLRPGGWRDYWTLLHPPYTLWHLSYVLLGASLAPAPDPRVVVGALAAFGLGVGVAAHSFDELRGRPLNTRIPSAVLIALGALALAGAAAIGAVGASVLGPSFLILVAAGVALVLAYAFEMPVVHSDLGFALAWGAFPVIATAFATGAPALATFVAATGAALVSLAQRRLSTPVRALRRRAVAVQGEIRYRDGTREPLDRRTLVAGPEAALRLLWLAMLAVSLGTLASRWWP